jgi:hypothetical protein
MKTRHQASTRNVLGDLSKHLVVGVNRFLLHFILVIPGPCFQHDDGDDLAIGLISRSNLCVCGSGDTIDDGPVLIDLPVRSGVVRDTTPYLFITKLESLNNRIR